MSAMRSLTSAYSGSSPRCAGAQVEQRAHLRLLGHLVEPVAVGEAQKALEAAADGALEAPDAGRRRLMSRRFSASTSRSENISSAAFWKCAIRNSRKCWCRNCASTPRSRQP